MPTGAARAEPLIFELGHRGPREPILSRTGKPLDAITSRPNTCATNCRFPTTANSTSCAISRGSRSARSAIDLGFYPLGSCTMKYNPRINDAMASLPRVRATCIRSRPTSWRKARWQVMYDLERSLASLFGMARVLAQSGRRRARRTAALLIAKTYFKDAARRSATRSSCPTPRTARIRHRRRCAASRSSRCRATSAGASASRRFKAVLGPDTAVCMMTNPNTLGLFEDHIAEIARAVHAAGGLMYYDGANANAIMGNARPGDMGFDLMHLNTHKTFTIPHGGGGAGARSGRRCGASGRLSCRRRSSCDAENGTGAPAMAYVPLDFDRPEVDRPDALVLVELRARGARARLHLRQRRRGLDARLAARGAQRQLSARAGRRISRRRRIRETCRHEFVASAQDAQARNRRARARLAKALLDRGYHGADDVLPAASFRSA